MNRSIKLFFALLFSLQSSAGHSEVDESFTIDQFFESIEGMSVKIESKKQVYELLFEPKSVASDSFKVLKICTSMINAIPPEQVSNKDFYVWNCPLNLLEKWNPEIEKLSYFPEVLQHYTRPTYPENALEESGYVILEYDVNQKGKVENIKIIESSNEKFNESALRLVKSQTFLPARKYGSPIRIAGRKFKVTFTPSES